jgi:hypothetical protein
VPGPARERPERHPAHPGDLDAGARTDATLKRRVDVALSLSKRATVAGLTPEQMTNWLSLYVATGICALLATFAVLLSVGSEVVRDRQWREVSSVRTAVLFVPKIW